MIHCRAIYSNHQTRFYGNRFPVKHLSLKSNFFSSFFTGSALLGPKAAMACTVAVESVIVEHYNDQLRTLMSDPEKNKELLEVIKKFRDDEQEHHDTGLEHGAEEAPFYRLFSDVIKLGCKTAISISKVI